MVIAMGGQKRVRDAQERTLKYYEDVHKREDEKNEKRHKGG